VRVDLARCGDAAWLAVQLTQPGMNRDAIGARVRFVAGGRSWVRDVRAGGQSYLSSGPSEVHVGLGAVDRLDRVEIRWPDGQTTLLRDVDTRQRLRVVRQ
jgi:hypothetical protein